MPELPNVSDAAIATIAATASNTIRTGAGMRFIPSGIINEAQRRHAAIRARQACSGS